MVICIDRLFFPGFEYFSVKRSVLTRIFLLVLFFKNISFREFLKFKKNIQIQDGGFKTIIFIACVGFPELQADYRPLDRLHHGATTQDRSLGKVRHSQS